MRLSYQGNHHFFGGALDLPWPEKFPVLLGHPPAFPWPLLPPLVALAPPLLPPPVPPLAALAPPLLFAPPPPLLPALCVLVHAMNLCDKSLKIS